MRHHTSCFQAFSNHLLRGGASEGEKVWKPAGGFRACLDRVQRSFGLGVDESFITPIKNLPSRWEQMRKLEGGGQRWEGVQEPERGREAASPATFPNEFEELYKNSNEEKIYTKHP